MIFGLLGSILSGGATGLLGTIIQRIADHAQHKLDLEMEKQKFEHDIALRKVDAEIQAQEWASRTKVAEVETAGASDVADSKAFAASYNEPQRYSEGLTLTKNQSWLMVALDFFKGAVRPGLTVYLCFLTTAIYVQAKFLIKQSDLTVQQEYDLVVTIINTILYLFTTCVLWYFGTRNKQTPPAARV